MNVIQIPTKYIGMLALWLALGWLFTTLSAEPSFYYSLVPKVGILQGERVMAQYANVKHCGKVVSVTANHVGEFIDKIMPNTKLLAASREYDMAIYEALGGAEPSLLAEFSPGPFDEVYIPTYVWMNDSVVVYRYPIIGYSTRETLIQGILFFGASGSGAYNSKGEYIGPVLNMLSGPGFGEARQQVNIGGIGRTDKLVEMFKAKVCSAP